MNDELTMLIIAKLNQKQSLSEINKQISNLEKSSSIKLLMLNVSIEKSLKKAVVEFNNTIKQLQDTNIALNVSSPFLTAPYLQSFRDYSTTLDMVLHKHKEITTHVEESDRKASGFGTRIRGIAEGIEIWANAAAVLAVPLIAMVDTIVTVDKYMNQFKRVMNEDTNFNELLNHNINTANNFGRTISEVNETALTLARQGFNEAEVLDLTKSTTLARNIADLDQQEAIAAITSAMAAFNLEASQSVSIVDKINAIDNQFSVSSKDLSLALQSSASAANAFGVSIEALLGDSTALMQATQISGDVAGEALSTIYSRLTAMPAIDALKSIKVDIQNSNGELKSTSQILDEVAGAFQNLNDETKQNTAVAIAG